ncbi:probable LRR receptor-like serine/threonine-protein kinase At3g47570 [Ipomoea triloba]|uniref:probable LRR receptor-like serine/threonine-protein kinase At3g47570 n=1 Tax=Ipomoea triloba TaxID=35885 RepID=UPI00125D3A2F|nr:probable LRR receptor-like serine/threonine-protein kinase At3g47570 [Ipomoea triloba]
MVSAVLLSQSIIVLIFSTFLPSCTSFPKPGNFTDHQALLSLKASIVTDPLHFTTSWNESTHFCEWFGVTCGLKHQRVTKIDLQSSSLGGSLSPSIGNLSFLREIMLYNNSFRGIIPEEIGRLSRLQVLNLRGNSFSGEMPKNISNCFNLIDLSLGANNLTGRFPLEFQSLFKLQYLALFQNNLVGEIPAYLGNFTSLLAISFIHNNFQGKIPTSLGQLHQLFFLQLSNNNLSGTIPTSIFNLSSLELLELSFNRLEGYLPPSLGSVLPILQSLSIGKNFLIGPLPISISNATSLKNFVIVENGFTGGVPSFSNHRQLDYFGLSSNPLGNGKSTDLDFMVSLLNSSATLRDLVLSQCNFGGILPRYIGNFSRLRGLYLGGNVIHGDIPNEIQFLVHMEELEINGNQQSGIIPTSLGSLHSLIYLDLSENKLSGVLPSSLGNFSMLSELYLQSNNLQGPLPASLEKSKNLLYVNLAKNNLNGYLPKSFFNPSSSLVYLDLSYNQFTGPLPVEIAELKILVALNLSNNMLSGELPSTLGALSGLIDLIISNNFFHGVIPPSLSSLKSLQTLDLSCNNLTGEIPKFLAKLQSLNHLNLSSNDFYGEIPTEGIFKNKSGVELNANKQLCGGIPQFGLPKCIRKGERQDLSRNKKLAIFISSGTLILILVALFVFVYKWKNKQSPLLESTIEISPRMSYWSLQKATNGFSESNRIGSGNFSTVYKGILEDGLTFIAIKVIKVHVRGASKSFLTECEALRQIRHRNLVRVLTSCCSIDHEGNDFKAIVYDYMSNGSLDNWLHNHSENNEENHDSKNLNLLQRVNIAIDVANALDYLHNHLENLLVHCDLKPSNILLDGGLVAHVGDFGLAKFLPIKDAPTSSSIGIKGTVGYAAPEYGMGSDLSTCGDMYSYGILLLEIFTGKSPTCDIFNNGLTLHNYTKMAIPEQVIEIVDPKLFHKEANATPKTFVLGDRILECLVSIFKIGIACSMELPRDRMNIDNAIKELRSIKDTLVQLGDISTIPRRVCKVNNP